MQATTLKQSFFRFFLFVGLAAAMVACKKDKDPNGPDPVPDGAKLQQYTNGEDYIRFTYNADGTVQKVILKDEDNNSGDEITYTDTGWAFNL